MAAVQHYDFSRMELEPIRLKKNMSKSLLASGNLDAFHLYQFANSYLDLHEKYGEIALSTMLSSNCRSLGDVEKVHGALVVLSKYASNLLQPEPCRPRGWNVIDFANLIFRERVYSVSGTQSILNKLGYQNAETRAGTSALVFPPVALPNRELIAEIYIELMAGKIELTNYLNQTHHSPSLIEKYLPFLARPENKLTVGKGLDIVATAGMEINLVEESKQKNENPEATVVTNKIPQDNIPLMVLDQMVSIPVSEDITAAEFLLGENKCDICGKEIARWTCHLCDNKNLCKNCDEIWHQYPKRRNHQRVPFGVQDAAAAPEIAKVVESKVADEDHLSKPVTSLNHTALTLPTTIVSMKNLASASTNNFATSKVNSPNPSPIISVKFAPSSNYNPTVSAYTLPAPSAASPPRVKAFLNDNKEDDFKTLLSKAKHPPPFYKPPLATGALRQPNSEFGAGYDIALAPSSACWPVSNVKNQSTAVLSGARGDQTSQPSVSVANSPVANSPLATSKVTHLKTQNANTIKEQHYGRSASSSGVLLGGTRATDNMAVDETKKLYWNCEYCTFANSGTSKICLMCHKTNSNVQIGGNDVRDDATAVKVAVTSPSHLVRASSAFEPLTRHKDDSLNRSANANSQFVSKFVDIQDEIYKEKKRAQEEFQREQSLKQMSTVNSHSMGDLQNAGNVIPKPAVTKSAFHLLAETSPVSQAHHNSIETPQPVNSVAHAERPTPVTSYSIDRKHYNSSFVDLADQIYIEKKAAQERFHQMEIENALTGAERVSNVAGNVELTRPQPTVFHGQVGAASNTNLKQPTPAFRDSVMKGTNIDNTLSTVEQLERERKSQDMFNDGLAVVRLIKAVEAKGFSDSEPRAILSICGTADPHSFYQNNWSVLVGSVIEKLQVQSIISRQSSPLKLVGLSLATSRGDVEKAVEEFKNLWQRGVETILRDCGLDDSTESKRQVISILDESRGDVETAKTIIVREKFLRNIWNDGGLTDVNLEIGADEDIYQQTTKHLNSDLSKILMDKAQSRERRTRMILAETHLPGWQRAENVLTILEEPSLHGAESTLRDIVDAVKNCGTVDESRQFLNQQCEICFDSFPCRLIKSMGCCQCKICSTCTGQYFEVVIRERFVRNLVCPVCSLPEIDTASEQTETHFQFLLLMLRRMVASETYELFQMKLRDWNLMMDPSFRWCASNNCKSGFLIDPDQLENKIACPHCRSFMCQRCKKLWEDQHDGLNCEEFQSWKENNDPEVQALGLARHLEENGIECPRCKCRYSLAKGGCMHFTCIQCRHEFCSGCLQPFRRGRNCTLLRSCAKAGLHCHHPRDCLFYLRDREVTELQQLLQDNGVAYDTEPSQTRLLAGPDGQRCSVMEQKQTQNGFKDEPCGKEVPQNFAGLCEIHYKEYLVGLINKNNIDPAKIMKQEELINLLNRVEKKVPKKRRSQTSEEYAEFLLKMVQDHLPLSQRQTQHTAHENSAMDQVDAISDYSANVADGQISMQLLRLDGEELIGRGVPRDSYQTLLKELGIAPNHKQMPRIKKDSGYSSLTLMPN